MIGNVECVVVTSALRHCRHLRVVNLSGNSIGAEGCRALADALRHCPRLRVVVLSHNSIGDEGCRALADALRLCPRLTRVRLDQNSIGAEECEAMMLSVPEYWPHLQTLDMSWPRSMRNPPLAVVQGFYNGPAIRRYVAEPKETYVGVGAFLTSVCHVRRSDPATAPLTSEPQVRAPEAHVDWAGRSW